MKDELMTKEIKKIFEEHSDTLPIHSVSWQVRPIQTKSSNYFEFKSNKYMISKLRPVNYYKNIINFIRYEEEQII